MICVILVILVSASISLPVCRFRCYTDFNTETPGGQPRGYLLTDDYAITTAYVAGRNVGFRVLFGCVSPYGNSGTTGDVSYRDASSLSHGHPTYFYPARSWTLRAS